MRLLPSNKVRGESQTNSNNKQKGGASNSSGSRLPCCNSRGGAVVTTRSEGGIVLFLVLLASPLLVVIQRLCFKHNYSDFLSTWKSYSYSYPSMTMGGSGTSSQSTTTSTTISNHSETQTHLQKRINLDPSLLVVKQQKEFYKAHYNAMKELFVNPNLNPEDNAENPLLWQKQNFMIWGTRDSETNEEIADFTTFYREFGNEFYDASDTNKNDQHLSKLLQGKHHYKYLLFADVCDAAKFFMGEEGGEGEQQNQNSSFPKHVLFAVLNENWGAFSEYVPPNKTIDWIIDLKQHWKETGCSLPQILNYLRHPNMLLAVTMQFQIFDLYPKVISLPLGLENEIEAIELFKYSLAYNKVARLRQQLLMINCQRGTTGRDESIATVIANFKGTQHEVQNTFPTATRSDSGDDSGDGDGDSGDNGNGWWDTKSLYYQEMSQSKFILTPGGLGFDCYRIWEAIIMGTVPIIETLNRTDGWLLHTLSPTELPIALIDSYDNLTPHWLEKEYQRIISKPTNYNYHRLTKPYWINLIKSHVTNPTTTTTTALFKKY